MKRELDYELAGSLDETSTQSLPQAGIQASDCVKAACENVRCKRFKVTKVNGFIVYSRVKRSRFSNSDDLLEDDVIDKRINSKIHEGRINKVVKNVLNENGIVESVVEEENQLVQIAVENVIEETVKGKKAPICKEEPISEVECFPRKEGGSEVSNGLNKKCLKRPSAMKPKVEPVEVLVTQSEGFGNESMSLIEVEAIAEGSALTSPKKNLELKMSKKISLNKKPMTVTELFETGLLDGVTVVYMGGIKASGLRGIIRDGGILCSCSLCNGCRVIPPSKFEIHACKQYRRASQYIRLHKLVFDESGLPDGTEVGYYACGQKLLEGYKNGLGIICHCCNSEVSPSQFEAHAGWSSRRKPYAHIYTSNGVSLHELAISLSKGRQYPGKDNDDLCTICADGGNLLPCDGCPRAFHKECASLSSIPQGDWYCKYCQNMFERKRFLQHDANAVEAGRVSGVDSVEQITKRCIRIVKNLEAELSGCLLCRGCDFSKSGFGPRTILLCDQCEREFHVGCLKKHKMADLRELPKGKWFCCMDCSRINSVLQNLLVQEAEKLPEFHLNAIKKYAGNSLETVSDIDVRWRLLSGKAATPETRLLLSQAVAIFHDCFDPIVDSISGRDLIPSMVYGRNLRGQEFGGMYCAILTVNSSVVSAGILRVFGQEVAELPLVATSKINHGKGYFQLLFACIEKLLSFLRVKSIVLPAAEEAESIWTDKFGFKKIDPELLSIYRKRCSQLVTFKGTSMLQKRVPACRIGSSSTDSTECVSGVEVG
ncbi:hypothetical protein CICLE_v10011125mg [Citrus x clementina]|uniref:PHD-type domain-containing protein n=1 Tax=Citrus clementina TaxID=85681 RepID=V4SX59_CITCL|nr:hypothetical protein CICLE_v10011125mg [Citrus x clementina]